MLWMSPPCPLPRARLEGGKRQESPVSSTTNHTHPCPTTRRAATALVTALAVVCSGCAHVVVDAPAPVFSMAVWNILHDDRDVAHVAEALERASPDVIGLSEVTANAWSILDDALSQTYPTRVFFDELALFSRLPIEDVREIPVEYGRKAQLLFTVVVHEARVDVALLHLHAPHVNDPSPAGVWRMLDDAERGHADEVGFALRRLKPSLPRVVMGDFNSLPFDDTRRRMSKRGYRDAAAELEFLPSSTWRGPLFGIEASLRIDYVFVSDGITPLELSVLHTPASDHALLVGRYRLEPMR